MNQPITLLHRGARSLLWLYQKNYQNTHFTIISGIALITVFFSIFPGYAQKRIGLHVTQEELDIWRSRARTAAYMEKTGPYQKANDVSANSPGDWDRILKNANAFVSNPSAERWSAYTGGGCVPRWSSEPGTRGEKMRDAGFAYLITSDKRYSEAVRKELLAHANNSLLDFSKKSRWCEGVLDDINPGFFIAEWMSRLLVGYDYIRTTVPQDERAKLDKWFANAAFYFQREVDQHINQFFVNRNSGNYTLTLYGNNSGAKRYSAISHYGGRQISNLAKVYNNRRGSMVRFYALVGIQQNIDPLKNSAKLYVKEWLRFSTFPDGIISEFYRWTSSQPDMGWSYATYCVAQALDVADHFARAGDMELYRYSTSQGLVGTEGGNKNIQLTIRNLLQYLDGSVKRYATTSASDVGKQHKLIDGIMPGWEVVSDIWFAQGNIYYKDNYIKNTYLRKNAGTRQYPYQQASAGPTSAWSGAGGIYPGKLFMFGQMEGKVWPYYTGSGTPPTYAPTPASNPTNHGGENTTITVNAWSTPAAGIYAHFNVLINGIKLDNAFANSRSEKQFRFSTKLKLSEINSIIIHFDNNGVHGREDRNLYVKSIAVGKTTYPSTGNNVTYDKGALDGKDVERGSQTVAWNGGLIFKLSGKAPSQDKPPVNEPPVEEPPVVNNPTPGTGSNAITVNARSNPAGGIYAHFNVLVNGTKIGEAFANSRSEKQFKFNTNLKGSEINSIIVHFDNNGVHGREDRDLYVKSIGVGGATFPSTGSNVTYDKGALDGKDVVKGNMVMPWNGGLIFKLSGKVPNNGPVVTNPPPTPSPSGSSKIAVTAYGSKAGGQYAHFNLLVNGSKVGEATTTGSKKVYNFTANIASSSIRTVTIHFNNDANIKNEDRNLIVKYLAVNNTTYKPTGSNVFLDKGELDGKDIRSGRELIPWDAGLVFNINGANAREDFSEENTEEIITGLHLSPNPTKGKFMLQLTKNDLADEVVYIAVYDVIGKLYYEEMLTSTESILQKNVDLSAIPEGMYLVKVCTNTQEIVKKLIKE
jgi:hypothetical protein